MIRSSSEQAVHESGSPFLAVNAVAKRSRQLLGGAPPLLTNANPEKPAMTAIREIAAGAVHVISHFAAPATDVATAERGASLFRPMPKRRLRPKSDGIAPTLETPVFDDTGAVHDLLPASPAEAENEPALLTTSG